MIYFVDEDPQAVRWVWIRRLLRRRCYVFGRAMQRQRRPYSEEIR
jgi:hypothetical protein